MQRRAMRLLLATVIIGAGLPLIVGLTKADTASASSLSAGPLTMVSTRADGTSGPALPNTFGAEQEAISEDGTVVAFVSPVPAEQLVTDPIQTGKVTDTNGKEDVFIWDSRVPAPVGPIVTLVSWNASHTGAANAASQHPIMAPLGLGIVFESGATDLVTVPVGASSKHLYAYVPVVSDLTPVFMVDVNYQGTAGSDSVSSDASIAVSVAPPSARVAFTSSGTDLVDPNVTPNGGAEQVYVRTFTLPTPSTQMVSVGTDGKGTVSGAEEPQIAADGIHVVFSSGGDSLVSGVNATGGDIFMRNLLTSSTTLISKGNATTQGTSGNYEPAVSANGSSVVWNGNDPNLSPTVHNGNNHVFYRSGNSEPQMVDTNLTGLLGCNNASNNPGISKDGLTVVFESNCSDIVGPTVADNSGTDVFYRRMSSVPNPLLPPVLVSINDAGNSSGNSASFLCPGNDPPHCGTGTDPSVTVSADGGAIAFFSDANDIGAATPPFSAGNVFVRHPDAPMGGSTVNVTLNAMGKNADKTSRDPVMSADGSTVALISLADDLVTPDTNEATDVFISDMHNKFVIQPIAPVGESDGTVTVTVTRVGANVTTDTVGFETLPGLVPDIPVPVTITDPAPATEDVDYEKKEGTLTFPPGVDTQTITITIKNDVVPEHPFEVFRVSLKDPTGSGSLALPGPLNQAYVGILDDDGAPQDWHVTLSGQPPASAPVGSLVPVKYTVANDAGPEALAVDGAVAGAGTTGMDTFDAGTAFPYSVAAGTSVEKTGTARVVGTPGTTTNHLVLNVTATEGAGQPQFKTVTSTNVKSTEAVDATLSAIGGGAFATITDQVDYDLKLTNHSDTAVTLAGLPAGFVAPPGTSQSSRADGALALAAHATTTWNLVVDVDDANPNGAQFTLLTAGVTYAMPAISLAARPVAITPASITTTVQAPVVQIGPHTVVDKNGGLLVAGDVVDVSVTVTNNGNAAVLTSTLVDTLTNLESPTDVKVDNVACGACSTTTSSVTAPMGIIPASGGAVTVTFSATVPTNPAATATSSAVVTFDPSTTGTSPTAADVATSTAGANDAPVAANDTYTTDEDTPLTVLKVDGVIKNDTDADNDMLAATLVSQASAHGTVVLAADGSFTYQPAANFNGVATFTYTVNDGTVDSNVATVTINLAPVDDATVPVDDDVVATSGEKVDFDVLANDIEVDGDTLTIQHTDVSHGVLVCATDGKCSYTPDANYTGPDSFTYTVDSGAGKDLADQSAHPDNVSAPAKVNIDVKAAGGTTTTTTSTTTMPGNTTTTTSTTTTSTTTTSTTTTLPTTTTTSTTTTKPGDTTTTTSTTTSSTTTTQPTTTTTTKPDTTTTTKPGDTTTTSTSTTTTEPGSGTTTTTTPPTGTTTDTSVPTVTTIPDVTVPGETTEPGVTDPGVTVIETVPATDGGVGGIDLGSGGGVGGGGLARTGSSNTLQLLFLGGTLVLLGAVLLRARRVLSRS